MAEAAAQGTAALLAGLQAQGGGFFDAAGWHYLELLQRRAESSEGTVRQLLQTRLEQAALAFAERFAQARASAGELVAEGVTQYPHAAAELQQLFTQGDFKRLRRRLASLAGEEQCASLAALVTRLDPPLAVPGKTAHRQPAHAHAPVPQELKTVRTARETWARLSVERQLSLAVRQGPANAGPINSHMLILRSLTMMQAISPDYVSQLVSYADTLLALDPGVQEPPPKRKKAATAKAARPKAAKKPVS